MSRAKALGIRVVLVLLASVVVANLLHRVVFTADPPDPATYPRAGDTFGSAAEGFKQHVVALRDGWVVLRTQVAPRAPGPPMHFHRSFAEVFTVESGKLDVELPDGTIQLGPGEQHRVEAEVPHRPYNPTDEEVIIASDKPAMPQSFAACLVQIYHFLDAAEGRMGPGLMVRLAALDPICDSTLPEIPAVVRVGTEWLIVPFARALGYNNYYPDHSLHPEGAAEGQTVPGQNPSSSITGTGVPNMRQLGLTSYKPEMAFPGYTLFAPMEGTAVYLIDMRGNVVHRWQLPYRPGEYGYLLDNGNLLFGGRTGKGPVNIGGRGGIVMEVDWEGNSVWEYEEDTLHHDHCRLDNGNTMVLGWERVPPELSRKVKGGISGTEEEEGMWSDYFREVDPQGKTVWEWHAYQHLDPDLDAICPIHRRDEWTHTNTLKVLPDGNLLTSFRLLDTVGIIDKATGEFT